MRSLHVFGARWIKPHNRFQVTTGHGPSIKKTARGLRFWTLQIHPLHLAAIDLAQMRLEDANLRLHDCYEIAIRYQDRFNIAWQQRLYARLHTLRNDLPAARVALAEAIDLFERLGMRRELAEARAELAQLDE
jgi:hypothetical protein